MRIETVDDGWVWIFCGVEHRSGEVMGEHVTRQGDRFVALEPLKQGLCRRGWGVGPNAASGLSVRLDHGTWFASDHFRTRVKSWCMELSHGKVKEPQTSGVVERFNRTLKEQVIRRRVFRDVAELRAAVVEFVARYNDPWLLEKNGHSSPDEIRALHEQRLAVWRCHLSRRPGAHRPAPAPVVSNRPTALLIRAVSPVRATRTFALQGRGVAAAFSLHRIQRPA